MSQPDMLFQFVLSALPLSLLPGSNTITFLPFLPDYICTFLRNMVVQESFCQFPEEIIFSEDCSTYRCIFDVLDGWWVSHSPILPLWLDSLEPDFIYCACRGWVFDLQMNHWSCNYCMGMEVWTSAGRGYGARMEIFALKWKSWSTFPFLKKMKNSNSFHLSWGGPMSFLLT